MASGTQSRQLEGSLQTSASTGSAQMMGRQQPGTFHRVSRTMVGREGLPSSPLALAGFPTVLVQGKWRDGGKEEPLPALT